MNFINLRNIQKGRTAFMGLAILWVIAFHYSFLQSEISKIGYLGVDIFILLSSFGLCFSLNRNNNYKDFIIRRLKRIIPTWWMLITIMFVINIILQRDHPHSLFQIFTYYSGLGWWFFHNEPFGIYYYEWYIPTLLTFYFFAPFLFRLNIKKLYLLLIASVFCTIYLDYYSIEPRLSLSYQRIPVFIYGVILYKMYTCEVCNKTLNSFLCLSSFAGAILFFVAVICGIGGCAVIIGFMFAMPLFLSLCYKLLYGKLGKVLSFIGTLTLELYLLHIYNLPLVAVMRCVGNRNISIIITTILLIVVSYVVSIVVNKAVEKLNTIGYKGL